MTENSSTSKSPVNTQNPQERLKKSEKKRNLFQAGFFLLTNGQLSGYVTGQIYRGPSKHICVPGLNCYSCPGALGACPMGSLQAGLYDTRQLFPFYVLSLLTFFGLLFGRLVCGLLCPFGFLQDLLAKIPVKKYRLELQKPKLDRTLRYFKYVILVLLVFMLPFMGRFLPSFMKPWFCKYICPSGTILAGWPLVSLNPGLQGQIGWLFGWKSLLAIGIVVGAIFIPRFFCRYLCPLGAFYGLFNKFAFFRLSYQASACIQCGACKRTCPMGIDMPRQNQSAECVRCGRCAAVCPTNCLHTGFKTPAAPDVAKCD